MYPTISSPIITFVILVLVGIVVYYEYTEHRLMKQRVEAAFNKMGEILDAHKALLDHVFGPDRTKLEAICKALAVGLPLPEDATVDGEAK